MTEETAAAAQAGVNGGFWNGVGMSALSVGANAAGSYTGTLGYLGELSGRTGRYRTLDPNNIGMLPSVYGGQVRATVAGNIEEGTFGKAGAAVYEATMSAADNLVRAYVGGGGAGSQLLASSGAFSQAVSQYSSQGASPGEAILMGIAQGGLEAITEKYSLDNLVKTIDDPKSAGRIMLSVLRSAGIEVTEEEASYLGGLMAETIVLRGGSAWNRRVQELRAQGMDAETARETATREAWAEAGETALQSALSGGIMAGTANAVGAYRNWQYDRTMDKLTGKDKKSQSSQKPREGRQTAGTVSKAEENRKPRIS